LFSTKRISMPSHWRSFFQAAICIGDTNSPTTPTSPVLIGRPIGSRLSAIHPWTCSGDAVVAWQNPRDESFWWVLRPKRPLISRPQAAHKCRMKSSTAVSPKCIACSGLHRPSSSTPQEHTS
jgi:hypothetical protein